MLFELLTKGIFKFRRNRLLETTDQLKLNFDENVLPCLSQTQMAFATIEVKGRFYVRLMDKFYEKTSMHRSKDWLLDLQSLVNTCRLNLNFLEDQVKKIMESDTYSDGITVQKAQLVNAIAGMEYISSNLVGILALALVAADDTDIGATSVSRATFDQATGVASKAFGLLSSYGQEPSKFMKLFKEIPDAIVTPSNREQVLGSYGKDADPYAEATQSGFVPNFPLIVSDQIAELRLWKYSRDKLVKKQIEQRIMYLKTRKAGESTAGLESQIKSYEKEVGKLQDKIDNFEQEYGG